MQIIVSALRGIGLRVRLVISFFPIPLKADSVPKVRDYEIYIFWYWHYRGILV